MNKRHTNIEVKKNNRNRVFRYICGHGIVSNPEDVIWPLRRPGHRLQKKADR